MSQKGTPSDSAVVEATFKSNKTEFVYPNTFDSLKPFEVKLMAYIG